MSQVNSIEAVGSVRSSESWSNVAPPGQAGARVETAANGNVAGGVTAVTSADQVDFRETQEVDNGALPLVSALQASALNGNTLGPAPDPVPVAQPGMVAGGVYGRTISGVSAGMQAGAVYTSAY